MEVAQDDTPSFSQEKKKGGRPVTFDWAGLAAHVTAYLVENDYPPQQSTLVQVADKWFTSHGKAPKDDREIEKWVSRVYQERDCLLGQKGNLKK